MSEAEIKGVPLVGQVFAMLLSLASTTVLTLFFVQRIAGVQSWRRLPFVSWLVFAIYIDSYLFVFATAILQHSVGVNSSLSTCEGAILLCLVCYVTTKVANEIHKHLDQKAHVIRGSRKPRLRSKLYIFNSFGMLGIYLVVALLNFIFRIAKIENGVCIIGMKGLAMIPLISFDTIVNVYLTCLFIIPLRKLRSFNQMAHTSSHMRLQRVAFRTLVGAVATLISSIINLTVLMVLKGEPGWICLMCCNGDILFSAAVVQWVTNGDAVGATNAGSSHRHGGRAPCDSEALCEMQPTRSSADRNSIFNVIKHSPDPNFPAEKGPRTPLGVVVTTTIQHETESGTAQRSSSNIRKEQPNFEFVSQGRKVGPQTSIIGG
ncbi:hypothetical protein HIM_10048 [Hirsutella minnesotensis 3608]|uniref:G-protein coupled receptors family 1 profile domain-containing protein n=1 Tax=Hirsutella minnesotensis 3608 TaxID=1043627 RepID=A0A0F7ZKG9_9HYPO|nr:hypothetical protein HIM_10048 [Hirsutella minnesotensis 3608]